MAGKQDKDIIDNESNDDDDDDDNFHNGPGNNGQVFDSSVPSDWPSLNPTSRYPVHNDGGQPTQQPHMMPTIQPSVGGDVVFELSLAPSSSSIMVTSYPTYPEPSWPVATLLPLIELSVLGPTQLDVHIPSFIDQFLDNVLRNNMRQYSSQYDYVQTIVDIVDEDLVSSESSNSFTVEVAGFAYFSVEKETREAVASLRESLSQALRLYFSVWGVDDLIIAMQQSDIPDIRDAQLIGLVIDHEIIYDDDTANEGVAATTRSSQKSNLQLVILLFSFAALVFLTLGITVVIYHRLKRSRQGVTTSEQLKEVTSPTKTDSAEDGESYNNDDVDVKHIQSIDIHHDDRSVFDMDLSVVSMFTNNMDGMSIVGPPLGTGDF